MLDEKALRKPGFRDGCPVKLADGQEWVFPPPIIRLYPIRNPGTKEIEIGGGPTYGRTYEKYLDEYIETPEDDVHTRIAIQFKMAVYLLQLNYDVSDEDLDQLIAIEAGSQESIDMWGDLSQVLQGQVPKRSPDGSAGPSSQTESEAT